METRPLVREGIEGSKLGDWICIQYLDGVTAAVI